MDSLAGTLLQIFSPPLMSSSVIHHGTPVVEDDDMSSTRLGVAVWPIAFTTSGEGRRSTSRSIGASLPIEALCRRELQAQADALAIATAQVRPIRTVSISPCDQVSCPAPVGR